MQKSEALQGEKNESRERLGGVVGGVGGGGGGGGGGGFFGLELKGVEKLELEGKVGLTIRCFLQKSS